MSEESQIIRGTGKIEIFSELPSGLQRGHLSAEFATAAAKRATPATPALTFSSLIYPASDLGAPPVLATPLEIGGIAYTADGKADVGALFAGLREEVTGNAGLVQVTKSPLLTANAADLARLTPDASRRGSK